MDIEYILLRIRIGYTQMLVRGAVKRRQMRFKCGRSEGVGGRQRLAPFTGISALFFFLLRELFRGVDFHWAVGRRCVFHLIVLSLSLETRFTLHH